MTGSRIKRAQPCNFISNTFSRSMIKKRSKN